MQKPFEIGMAAGRAVGRAAKRVATRGAMFGMIACAAALVAAGCGDDNTTQPSTSFEAKGLVLTVNGADSVVDSSGVHGTLTVLEGDVTSVIAAAFIGKSDGKRTTPGSGYTLSWTVADTTVATIESASSLSFKVRGKKAGTTTAIVKLLNGSTSVYTSAAITINVTPSIRGLRVGDTATFNFSDRDTNNQKVAGSERVKVWTVLRSNLDIYGKSNVMEIQDVTYDASGTAEVARDTIYMQMADDGSVYQYDLLRFLLARVSGGDAFSSKLDPYWVKISNTTAASAATWSSIGIDSILVSNVTAPGLPSMNVVFKMMAYHKGMQSVTVPAGTYPSAAHTDHTLKLDVKLASFPLSVLNDSLHVNFDITAKDGLLRSTFEGKKLVAQAATVSQTLPVTGFDMELKSIKRKP